MTVRTQSWKEAVRVATTATGTLATAFENGDTIDGVTLVTGNRILLKNQSTGSQNGIYVVAASGAPARAYDLDTSSKALAATVRVMEGTANGGKVFACTTAAPITLGTTALVFAEFGAAAAGAPSTVDYLVGTADAGLSAEIVVGTSPGGELGGTWASPTIDSTHSGSTHAGAASAAVTTHEGLADPHTGYRLESADHTHATTGLQGGTVAHSVLTGISATDHHAAPAAGPDANVTIDSAGAAGTASTFARAGHGHQVTTTDAPSGANISVDAAASAAATGAIARAAHGHRLNTYGSNAAAIGTAAAGTSTTAPSRGDHVHPTGAGTPSTQAFGDAAATGTGPAAAMTDHKHAMPSERAASSTTPASIGTAAVGTGTTDARSDHVHATGAGTPSTQAFGDAAATGTGPAAAMTDHKHAMPANPVTPGTPVAPGSVTLATERFLLQYTHLKIASTDRLTMAGTARVILDDLATDTAELLLGTPKIASSFVVPSDYVLDQLTRLTLREANRATLRGTADLVLTDDFGTRSRIVLAGRG